MEKEHKVAIIGPKKLVAGLGALGVETIIAEDGTGALEAIKKMREDAVKEGHMRYAVVIILERIAGQIPHDEYIKATAGPLPAFVMLPDVEASSGAGLAKLKRLAERAVGSDILG